MLTLLLLSLSAGGVYLLLNNGKKEIKRVALRNAQPSYSPRKAEPLPAQQRTPVTLPTVQPPSPAIAVESSMPSPPSLPGQQNSSKAIQIERDEEGTINLIIQRDQLRLPPADKTDRPEPTMDNRAAGGIVEEEDSSTLQPDADWPEPASLPEPCDCTHIVVKGDTLWDIAKQYTNNAYNYPELARQSGISNPHRIYPGNTVRIIVH